MSTKLGQRKHKLQNKVAERLKEIRERGLIYREATTGTIDQEARTVELSFSSEVEYERWYGIEILGHGPGECDLARLNNKAPLLWMHDWEDQRGVIESAQIVDGKGRCVVRFSRSDEAEELFQDVIDGIVTKVSVGYMVNGMKLVEERENDVDVYRVTAWQPYEVSLVSVPADDTVGVGRSAEKPQVDEPAQVAENASVEVPQTRDLTFKDEKNMSENTPAASAANAQAERQAGADAERARVRELTELGKSYGNMDLAVRCIEEGKSAADMQRELLFAFGKERASKPLDDQAKDANIGMTDKEVRTFSLMKAIRAMVPDATKADKDAAAFELECSRAAAERYGKSPKGIIIPNDVLASRAFGTGMNGTSGAGSNAIQTTLMAGSFIELLRHKAWVMKRARTMGGLVGNVDIPRQSGPSQAYWVGEGNAPTAGTPTLDQIAFTPKTVGAYTDITRRLMKQATPDAEAIVRDDLLKIMALEIDRVAIYGTGGENMPKGVKNITGINAVTFATAGQPSYAELVDMETQIALDDADVEGMSYAFNAAIRGHLKTTLKFPTAAIAQGGAIWEPGNTVNGYDTSVSNQLATGDVFFGNWQDLIIAMWGGLELTVDPYSLSTSGGLRLIALQDVDMNVRHPVSFCYGTH